MGVAAPQINLFKLVVKTRTGKTSTGYFENTKTINQVASSSVISTPLHVISSVLNMLAMAIFHRFRRKAMRHDRRRENLNLVLR